MRNFIATRPSRGVVTIANRSFTDEYQTVILDGWQRWRRPGDKKFYDDVPSPPLKTAIVSAAEWSELPQMVGTEFNLKIHQAPDAVVGGRTVHVFQYAARV